MSSFAQEREREKSAMMEHCMPVGSKRSVWVLHVKRAKPKVATPQMSNLKHLVDIELNA